MNTDRRTFLKTSALAGVALTAPAIFAQSPARKYRTALIGSGWWGKVITEMAMKSGTASIVAVCDVDRTMTDEAVKLVNEKAGNTPKVYGDYRELLAKEKPEISIVA